MDDTETLNKLVGHIARHLAKPAQIGSGPSITAIAETAVRFNDSSWFWTDDNAKTAELLCLPHIRDQNPALAEAALDFVLRLSRGTVIQRRGAAPEISVVADDPKAFHVRNAFVNIEGDLSRGVLRPSARFNDGRGIDVAHHTGNYIEFKHAGRRYRQDIEDGITAYALVPGGRSVAMRHTTTLKSRPGWLPGRAEITVGTVTYEYTLFDDRSTLELLLTVAPAPGVVLEDVIATTAIDQAGQSQEFRTLCVGQSGTYVREDTLGRRSRIGHTGAADYVALIQHGNSPGFSYGMHCLLRTGDRVQRVVTTCKAENITHWMVIRYALGRLDAAVTLSEARLMTAGGYYDDPGHYKDVMASGAEDGIDPSMTYDIGAELNAVAVCYLFGTAGRYTVDPPSPARLAELKLWYDRHLDRYFEFLRVGEPNEGGRTFIRGLGFTALSLDCMLRATGDQSYKTRMDTACTLLLRLFDRQEVGNDTSEGSFIDSWTGRVPFLDVHAAGMLALSRCAAHGDPGSQYQAAVADGVRGVRLVTLTVSPGPGSRVYCDQLGVSSRVPETTPVHWDTGYWNFKMGLLLRALHAVQRADASGALPLDEAVRDRTGFLIGLARRIIGQSTRDHGDTLEVLTSHRSGETNSETQPWVSLGLVPIGDELIGAIPVPAPSSP